MVENIGSSGVRQAPDTSGFIETRSDNDVNEYYASAAAAQTAQETNIIIQETILDTSVQIKPFNLKNGVNFLTISCVNKPIPEIDEMESLGRLLVKNTDEPEIVFETEYTHLLSPLAETIERFPLDVIGRFGGFQTDVVACKTVKREIIDAARREGESRWLKTLTESERLAIEKTLGIIKKTESVWLVNTLKYACSVRSEELTHFNNSGSTSFEHKETTWYEISWDKELKKKIRNAITSYLPDFMRDWLTDLRVRRENLRKVAQST